LHEKLVEALRRGLEDAIKSLPEGFYDTFNYVTTGTNLCHPITLGLLAKVVGEMDGIGYVGVDVRLNDREGLKFQPDIVGYHDENGIQQNQAAIFVDFQSPNGCDARITTGHHLRDYLKWVEEPKHRAPYVMVTSLPDAAAPKWELRFSNKLNALHKERRKEIRDNPFQYWKKVWADDLQNRTPEAPKRLNLLPPLPLSSRTRPSFANVIFLNINRDKVVQFQLL
jgi:hypothetical protein